MQISYQPDGSLTAAIKGTSVRFGAEVRIGDYSVPGAGEYDVAAIQCEAHALPAGLAYFLHAEDLTITYLSALVSEVTKIDEASSTDILIADLRSDSSPDDFRPILKSLEPSYVFLTGSGATPEFGQSLGLSAYEGASLKVTRSSLPLEGTFLVSRA
jgi:hypothetical protein